MRRRPNELRAALLTGLLSGLAGALMFAAAHALLIVPIWTRMGSGLLFAAAAGTAAGWAFAEMYPQAVRERSAGSLRRGIGFGALLWFAVAPVTTADAALRALRLAARYELLAVGVALVLAVLGGWIVGWQVTRRRRAALAAAAATLLLVVAMAGPVPVGRSPRALGIFLAVLPAAVVAGIALALVSPTIYKAMPRRTADGLDAPSA